MRGGGRLRSVRGPGGRCRRTLGGGVGLHRPRLHAGRPGHRRGRDPHPDPPAPRSRAGGAGRRKARLVPEADGQLGRRGPGHGRRGRGGRADPPGQRVLPALPATRTGQAADRRRRHRAAHQHADEDGRGTDRLGLPGRPRGRRVRLAHDLRQPRGPPVRRHDPQVRRRRCGCSTRTSSRSRRWCGGGTPSSSRAPAIFEYEDPGILGTMDVALRARHVDAEQPTTEPTSSSRSKGTKDSCG